MKINISSLKDVIRKSTLNYVIPSVQLKFENSKIISNMVTQSMDAVIMLNLDNNILDIPSSDSFSFNFSDPNINVKPYIDLVDEDLVDAEVSDEYIKIKTDKKQKLCFHFSSSDFVSSYKGNKPEIDEWFFKQNIDDDLMDKFNKIKKIAGKFGKIYFSVKNKILSIEATDKQTKFANSMKFELGKVDKKDISLCFNFNNINALLTLIKTSYSDFEFKIHITENEKGGMILFKQKDGSENYYFVSKNE
jgi:hypothetical protein